MERNELLKKIISFSEAAKNEDNEIREELENLGLDIPLDLPSDMSDIPDEYKYVKRPKYGEFIAFLDTLSHFDIAFIATLGYAELYEELSFDELFYYIKSSFEREDILKTLRQKVFLLPSSLINGINFYRKKL